MTVSSADDVSPQTDDDGTNYVEWWNQSPKPQVKTPSVPVKSGKVEVVAVPPPPATLPTLVFLTPEKNVDVAALARSHSELAIMTLVQIAKSGDKDADRTAAARALIAIGYGGSTARPTGPGPRNAPAYHGKKAMAEEAAKTAGQDSEWGDDLLPTSLN